MSVAFSEPVRQKKNLELSTPRERKRKHNPQSKDRPGGGLISFPLQGDDQATPSSLKCQMLSAVSPVSLF
jgi:hypothetical protein